ncbi:magnesium and cobalt transport protein CorA [Saccharopolyspora sp. K220]|uniref:magnesium and cobalt transport protein CorA n=1 Tax=Saccharopolyspora soli TaxID=2926618 RepID=UPI001F57114F|nr:magnesium and cobalt transport protein CorA [Saccharopolyspora soli]MCI2423594.1 magnesium and cobalt transport protein CorA [Saccharopolyspora soli]
MLRCTRFHNSDSAEIAEEDIFDALRQVPEDAFVWLEVPPERFDVLREAARLLDLPRLAVENAMQGHQRAKIEPYPGCLFIALKVLGYHEGTSAVRISGLVMLVSGRVLITVRHGDEDPATEAHRRAADRRDLLTHGPLAVVYLLADTVVDAYLAVSAELAKDLVALEQRVFAAGRDDPTAELYALKREVLEFREAVEPLLPVAHRFKSPEGGARGVLGHHFRDVADHVVRAGREVLSYDELLNSVLAAQFSRAGLWQNEDMRKISAWAALALVPTIVGAIYGMNFEYMPELHWVFGYPLALLVIVGVCWALYATFRRNGWL